MQHPDQRTNRLAEASSPYLQQHARNPVDWWPWCEEALALARAEDKPILLSIGYSACHWCHVMAHESFEDPATAAVMNKLFVNIKVDREERPDLDKVYQMAHQLLAQRAGGWPLTLFLTPDDQKPFFAGTYFPKEPRHGLPSFTQLMQQVERAYREQQDAIRAQNDSLMQVLSRIEAAAGAASEIPGRAPMDEAYRQLHQSFDRARGGFGDAPKFPHPTNLDFLLRRHAVAEAEGASDREALHMAAVTLTHMIRGGVNDQLGGGFYRYSVDAEWMIPHFEKMLYDNGPLLALCCDAWRITGDALFRDAARATADWVMREMQSPEGGYYSTLDADSEGEEGKFYVWDRGQVKGLLTQEQFRVFAAVYGLDGPPNFEGRYHLRMFRAPEEVAAKLDLAEARALELLAGGRDTLLAARAARVRPGRDEKVLTAWNALMIKGMARTARVLEHDEYLASAEDAVDFIHSTLWHNGRLLATYRDGRAHLNAYLDDYAYLIDALLELLQTRWRRDDLDLAIALAEVLLARFRDHEEGGFFFTSDDHEPLIHRPKPLSDESVPAGNGVAAQVLQRLGHLLGRTPFLEAARGTLAVAAEPMRRVPYAHASLLSALDEHLDPPEILVIRGTGDDLQLWQRAAHAFFAPRRLVLAIPSDEEALPGALHGMRAGGVIRAYRCMGTSCSPAIEDLNELRHVLSGSTGAA
jgi:uncharacterized protein YyaL (SSP411 family)